MTDPDATRPTPPTASDDPPSSPVSPSLSSSTEATARVDAALPTDSGPVAVDHVVVVSADEAASDVATAWAETVADGISGPVVVASPVETELDASPAAVAAAVAVSAAEVSARVEAHNDETAADDVVIDAVPGVMSTATVAGAVVVSAEEQGPALAAAANGASIVVPVIGEISAPMVEVIVRWKERVLKALPFISLVFAIVGAVWMDRKPSAAWFIVVAAVVGWALVIITAVLVRRTTRKNVVETIGWKHKAGALLLLFASQSVMQTALAFPLPFFFRAASWWPPVPIHLPFIVTYAVVLVVSSWDPWYEYCATKPLALFSLQAFSAFVALLTVLPLLGLDNTATFISAGLACAVGVPFGLMMFGPRRWRTPLSVWAGIAVAVLVFVGAPLIPPAPLSLVKGVMATSVQGRAPDGVAKSFQAPSQLLCHTAIGAPLGLKDTLVHVWTRDGAVVQRVPLTVSGGADAGFRTWSRLNSPKPGRYRCRIETERGQVVGDVRATVK